MPRLTLALTVFITLLLPIAAAIAGESENAGSTPPSASAEEATLWRFGERDKLCCVELDRRLPYLPAHQRRRR